jgi:hypothetical protein
VHVPLAEQNGAETRTVDVLRSGDHGVYLLLVWILNIERVL